MGEVVSLKDKLERWTVSYKSPGEWMQIKTSTHGRIIVLIGDEMCELSTFESVRMLKEVSEGMEAAFDV